MKNQIIRPPYTCIFCKQSGFMSEEELFKHQYHNNQKDCRPKEEGKER